MQLTSITTGRSKGRDARSQASRHRLRVLFYLLILVSDTLALSGGFVIAGAARFGIWFHPQALTLLGVLIPVYLVYSSRSYVPETLQEWRPAATYAAFSLVLALSTVLFVAFFLKAAEQTSRIVIVVGMVLSAMLLVGSRLAVGRASAQAFPGGAKSKLLILDGVELAAPAGVPILRAADLDLTDLNPHPLMLDRLAQALTGVDDAYIACDSNRRQAWARVMKGSSVRAELLVPELNSFGVIGNDQFAGVATVLISTGAFNVRDRIAKRLLDLALVLPTVMLLSPILLMVAFAIKLDSRGPVLFIQRRVGQGNRIFRVFKFRSMLSNLGDDDGQRSTGRSDPRVTRVGRFIRKYSIDELPQLFNILRGDMSIVGPRPHAIGSLAGELHFWEADYRYHHRHVCKPGLTGLAQIRGFRGNTERREDLVNRVDADLEYINGWSVQRDLAIMFATLRVISHKNAY